MPGEIETVRAPGDGGPWRIFRADDDSPERQAGPLRAFLRFWSRWAVFSGRAGRAEFWWMWLINTALYALLAIGLPRLLGQHPSYAVTTGLLGPVLGSGWNAGQDSGWNVATGSGDGLLDPTSPAGLVLRVVTVLFSVSTLVPTIALAFRRLHDIGRSGWFGLLALAGPVGTVVLFVMAIWPPSRAGARFDRPVRRLPERTRRRVRPVVGVAVSAIAVSALVVVSTVTGLAAVPGDLWGSWTLVSLTMDDRADEPLPDRPVTFAISGATVSGSDACNAYQATVASSTPFTLIDWSTTLVGCDDEYGRFREEFRSGVVDATGIERHGDTLVLTSPHAVLRFERTATR